MKSRKATAASEIHAGSVEQWVSVDQIAKHLNVKPDTVYKWLERKDMPAHKVGRLWRFKISEVDYWVKSGEAKEDKES